MSSSETLPWNKNLLDSITAYCQKTGDEVPNLFLGRDCLCVHVHVGFAYVLEIREDDSRILIGAHPSDLAGNLCKELSSKTKVDTIAANIKQVKEAIGAASVASLRKGDQFDEISEMLNQVLATENKQLNKLSECEKRIAEMLNGDCSEDDRKEFADLLQEFQQRRVDHGSTTQKLRDTIANVQTLKDNVNTIGAIYEMAGDLLKEAEP